MTRSLYTISWPSWRLGEILEALAARNGFAPDVKKAPTPPNELHQMSEREFNQWIREASHWMGFEVEPVEVVYQNIDLMLLKAGPAILRMSYEGETRFLAVHGSHKSKLSLLSPSGDIHRVPVSHVRSAVCLHLEGIHAEEMEAVLAKMQVPAKDLEKARQVMIAERLRGVRLTCCWIIKPSPSRNFLIQMRQAGLFRHAFWVMLYYTASHLFWVFSWWIIGHSALSGNYDPGLLIAWALMLISTVPLEMLSHWYEGLLSIGFGRLLKQRTLLGALRLNPDDIKRMGSGQLLARAMEATAFENFTLGSAINTLFALIDIGVACWVLSQGASTILPWLLVIYTFFAFGMGWWLYKLRVDWTESRVSMTNELVERLIGHRTRLAQEPRNLWHEEEDWDIKRYLDMSRAMDDSGSFAFSLIPRGWLFLGMLGFTGVMVGGSPTVLSLGITLGGILLAMGAFNKIRFGFHNIAQAVIAWKNVGFLYKAAGKPEQDHPPTIGLLPDQGEGTYGLKQTVLETTDLRFRYGTGQPLVLNNCHLTIFDGDRILLEGPSGSGKSTFASLILGINVPESGLILLHGLDRHSIGPDGWRKRVSLAPQFNENHVFSGTFAFNLLMGREWPPKPEDLREATMICQELGLGDLLERMPSGMTQMVGESGWRLSHGEMSRLFIARAILQGAELMIFDESFGTLDPENLRNALRCVFKRAPCLLVIAHP